MVLQRIQSLLTEKGLRWTCYFVLVSLLKRSAGDFERIIDALDWRMEILERKRQGLPGDNTVAENVAFWQRYDWTEGGEEWTPTPGWKQSVIQEVMLKYVEPGKTILEVGPGVGRWTETLQKIAQRLILVDVSDKCIELCQKRFAGCDNVEFFVNDGVSLAFIADETVDFIWSFDVFVHISPQDTEKYLMGFKRILKKGGRGIIHHPKEGGYYGGWRSNMTDKLFSDMLQGHGLTLVTQFDTWRNDEQIGVRAHHDAVSVFEK